MQLSLHKIVSIVVLGSSCFMAQAQEDCNLEGEALQEEMAANLGAGIYAPIGVSAVFIIILCLPLCCGVGKNMFQGQKNACKRRMIGFLCIIIAILLKCAPAMSVGTVCNNVLDHSCENCGMECDPDELNDWKVLCTAAFSIGVYMLPMTMAGVALSAVMMAFGFTCCCVCSCCPGKLSEEPPAEAAKTGGSVIGQAVSTGETQA